MFREDGDRSLRSYWIRNELRYGLWEQQSGKRRRVGTALTTAAAYRWLGTPEDQIAFWVKLDEDQIAARSRRDGQ